MEPSFGASVRLCEGGIDPSEEDLFPVRNPDTSGFEWEARALPGASVPAFEGWRVALDSAREPAGLLRETENTSATP